MAEDLEGVVFNIRALIVSSKHPIPLKNLSRDYETVIESPIPFRSFNHNTLESFLRSIPTLKITGNGRDAVIEAVKDEASSHISQMIAKQRPAKRGRGPPVRRGGYSQRGSYSRSNYVPRPVASSRYTTYPPSSHQPQPKREYSGYSNSVDQKNANSTTRNHLMVRVASDDRRQVSLGENHSSSSHSQPPQKETRPSYELPPRFQRNRQQSFEGTSSSVPAASVNDITKDVEENLFLEGPIGPDPRLRERDNNIISAMKPSKLVAVGRVKQQVAQSELEDFCFQGPSAVKHANKAKAYKELLAHPEMEPALMALVPSPDLNTVQNNVKLLLDYSIAKKWEMPEFKVVTRQPKGSSAQYGVNLKLNTGGSAVKTFSCPPEFESVIKAKGIAAQKALQDLFEEEKLKLQKPIISSDKSIIIDRISKIVDGKYNGMFANTLESLYMEQHTEQLPGDWLDIVRTSPTLSVEASLNNNIIIPIAPSLDLNLEEPLLTSVPLVLVPPEEDTWDVFITSATSTCKVWLRLIGENYSEKYEELLTNMERRYKGNDLRLRALAIEEGGHYAAESNDGWHRVCVTEVNDQIKTVYAFLIDHGDNDMFAFQNLYTLPKEFCTLPRQAIQCCLEGLESFSEDPSCYEILSSFEGLIGNSLVAQVNSRNDTTGTIKVTLFDTSGADDININEKIRDHFTSNYEKAVPKMPKEGLMSKVCVSHISKRGEVYIQIPNEGFAQMADLIESLGPEEINKNKLKSFRQVQLNKLYLAQYNRDENWYRAVVTSTSVQQNKIVLKFIDYGNSETVSISEITEVENLHPIISALPPQAVKVNLNNLEDGSLSQSQIETLHTLLLGENKLVFIKLLIIKEGVPIVDLYCKDEVLNGAVVYVNLTLAVEKDKVPPRLNKEMSSEKLSLPNQGPNENGVSCMTLTKPSFDNGEFTKVSIVLAANPGNFFFQLVKYSKDLVNLMHQLQNHYHYKDLPTLKEEEIVTGDLYTCLHKGSWYRVVVTESIVIDSNVPVHFIDFGDMVVVPVSYLRKLDPLFCDKPFMAIKGKLAGVLPTHKDWSVEDCIRFNELVINKALDATVVHIDNSHKNPMEMVVSLHLTNTLSEKDIVIADVLCEEERAFYDNNT